MAGVLSQTLRRWVGYPDLAIDLGTATTRLVAADSPSMLERPSVIIPDDARQRSPLSPLRGGVVVDCEAAASVLEGLFHGLKRYGLIKPRVLACAPTDATDAERAALVRAVRMAGAAAVEVAPEPLAAAIGAGLDVSLPRAQMVVDIGEGVTDIAVIRSGTLVSASAIRVACGDLHAAVGERISSDHGAFLPRGGSERLIKLIGADFPSPLPAHILTRAITEEGKRDTWLKVDPRLLWRNLSPIYEKIVKQVGATLRDLPPSLFCEVIENGICLTGGGALLPGISRRLFSEVKVDVKVAGAPLHAVIDGARAMLSTAIEIDLWRR